MDRFLYLPALYTRYMDDLTTCWKSTRHCRKKDQPQHGLKPVYTYPITLLAPDNKLQYKPRRLPHWNGYKTLDQKIGRNIHIWRKARQKWLFQITLQDNAEVNSFLIHSNTPQLQS